MSNFRIPDPTGAPQGVPADRLGQPPARPAPPALGQPTSQPAGRLTPPVAPARPQQPPTAGVRPAQPDTLRRLQGFRGGPNQPAAHAVPPGNVAPNPPQQAPVSFSHPYPSGGPGAAQPYAQPYQASTQRNRGLRYARAALVGGGLFAVLPTIQLLAALPNGGGGLGASTLLGYGVPIILRSLMMGAGLGVGIRAFRERREKKHAEQLLAWQGQQSGMAMPYMPQPGSFPPQGYAPSPQGAWGYPQGYQGNAPAPTQWPVNAQQSWPQQGGGPAVQPPMNPTPSGTFGPPHPSYSAPVQHPTGQAPTGSFGPPPAGYGAPAPQPAHSPQPRRAGDVSAPAVPPQPSSGRAGGPSPTAQPTYPNNSAGAKTPTQILERFSPERRKGVIDQLIQGMQNYPVAGERAAGFAEIAQAIPLLADNAWTPGGRFDEKLAVFRTLYAEKKNVSASGAQAIHEALRKVFGSLTPGARAAFLRDNKDADFAAQQTS